MFENACTTNREAIYGLLASSPIQPQGITASNGSAFMVAPGFLITAAHCVHQKTDHQQPLHTKLELIRIPEIGQRMEVGTLHAIDDKQDIAILKIEKPRSTACLALLDRIVMRGSAVGSLGFPLAQIGVINQQMAFNVVERFQGANISAYVYSNRPDGTTEEHYETDSLMYGGSSGCPGFFLSGEVWGMHNRSVIEEQKAGASGVGTATRLAISLWVPSTVIGSLCRAHGVPINLAAT